MVWGVGCPLVGVSCHSKRQGSDRFDWQLQPSGVHMSTLFISKIMYEPTSLFCQPENPSSLHPSPHLTSDCLLHYVVHRAEVEGSLLWTRTLVILSTQMMCKAEACRWASGSVTELTINTAMTLRKASPLDEMWATAIRSSVGLLKCGHTNMPFNIVHNHHINKSIRMSRMSRPERHKRCHVFICDLLCVCVPVCLHVLAHV